MDIIQNIVSNVVKLSDLIINMPFATLNINNADFDQLLVAIRKRKNNNKLVIKLNTVCDYFYDVALYPQAKLYRDIFEMKRFWTSTNW